MTLLIADSFNRADSTTTLGSTDGAGTLDPVAWTAQAGTWGINGNAAYTNGNPSPGIATVDSGHSNVDVTIEFTSSMGVSTWRGLVVRFVDMNNYFHIVCLSNNAMSFRRMLSGGDLELTSFASAFQINDKLRVTAINNVFTIYRIRGGVTTVLGRAIDSNFRSATKHGVVSKDNTGFRLDNFSLSNIPVLPTELAVDSFNRANNASIGSTDGTGSLDPIVWQALSGFSAAIVSNEATHSGGSTVTVDPLANGFSSTAGNLHYIDAGTPDVQIHLKADFSGNSVVGVVFRFVDVNNYWLFYIHQTSNQVFLFKRIGGVWFNVSGTLAGPGTTYVYSVRLSGSTIILETKGAVLYTTVDTDLESSTKHGFWVGGGGLVDTFQLWTGDPIRAVVAQVGPTEGPVAGGTNVTIVGNNFTGVTAVHFGATPATSFTVISDGYIEAVAPAHVGGLYNIILTTAAGDSDIVIADQFTFVVPIPVVSSVTPNHGVPAGGTSVVITGAYFTGATAVKFGTTNAASFTVDNDGQITAVTPVHASGVSPVVVTTPSGSSL